MAEDPSVDASEWSRAIILAQLGSENSKFQTKELARKLRRQICVSHPIHKYLNDLPNDQLKLVHSKIVDMKRDLNNEQACSRNKQKFSRMKVMVAKFFFLSYPKSPMTSLRLFIENGCLGKLEMPKYSREENLEFAGDQHLDEYRKVFNRI